MKSGARNKPQGEASTGTLQTGQTSPMLPACSIPKPQKVQQDEERLNFVRNMPCLVAEYGQGKPSDHHRVQCLCFATTVINVRHWPMNCEAHHVRKGTHTGASRKPPANRTVPLCQAGHTEYHTIGHDTFCKKYGLDLEAHLRRINAEYDALHPKKVILASFKLKPVRKRKQKATLHIVHCAGCSHAHEIPTRKLIINKNGVMSFRCIQTNRLLEV